jgi:hypothetical protein
MRSGNASAHDAPPATGCKGRWLAWAYTPVGNYGQWGQRLSSTARTRKKPDADWKCAKANAIVHAAGKHSALPPALSKPLVKGADVLGTDRYSTPPPPPPSPVLPGGVTACTPFLSTPPGTQTKLLLATHACAT